MTNMIPAHLHGDLSPLLVRAGAWPDARALSVVPPWTPPDAATEAERLARRRPVPPDLELELEGLLAAVAQLVRPELRAGARSQPLYWTAERALYHRLRPPRPEADEDRADEASSASGRALPPGWPTGWASWAPTAGGAVRAFCLYGHWRDAPPGADAATLLARLGQLVAPALAEELAALRPHPAPAVRGPDDHAAIFRLDPAGFGVAYSYLYAYTNGVRVVAAIQPLVHRPL
ncbi:MAG: hypothetical protein M9894_32420 [Planctomycetes bacterium]|nr:hypothetical protein [Planctomycetota bacterium]